MICSPGTEEADRSVSARSRAAASGVRNRTDLPKCGPEPAPVGGHRRNDVDHGAGFGLATLAVVSLLTEASSEA